MAEFVSERAAVRYPFVRCAVEVDWTYLWPDEALRLRGGMEHSLLCPPRIAGRDKPCPYTPAQGATTSVVPHVQVCAGGMGAYN